MSLLPSWFPWHNLWSVHWSSFLDQPPAACCCLSMVTSTVTANQLLDLECSALCALNHSSNQLISFLFRSLHLDRHITVQKWFSAPKLVVFLVNVRSWGETTFLKLDSLRKSNPSELWSHSNHWWCGTSNCRKTLHCNQSTSAVLHGATQSSSHMQTNKATTSN